MNGTNKNCRACQIIANDEQVKQMPMHTCGKDGPIEKALPKTMNGTNEHEGREEKTYFKLSKNEHGRMWLFYKPPEEDDDRYDCWWPINEQFYTEFTKLLDASEQLASERALRKELVDILTRIKPLAEDGHAMHKRNGCHQEFLSEDIERLQIVESLLHKSKPLDEKK